jgi:diguanylate cyclase (GGDEF)-like protein/PAS domain S-box-containing protein
MDNEIYRAILESLGTGVYLVDRERRIQLWNDGAEKITGYLRQEVTGRLCSDNLLMHCDQDCRVLCGVNCPLLETMREGKPAEADVFLRHKDGQRVPVRVRAVPVRDADGEIIGAAESFDERVLLPDCDLYPNNHAVHDLTDGLTGTLDHHSIESHLAASMLDFTEYHVPFSILVVAIDGLNEFRDIHGRRAVEAVLSVVARTLARNLHVNDKVGRWGDGGFLIIAMSCPAQQLTKLAEMLRRIVGLVAVPWWGDRISVTISVGATAVRADDTTESAVHRSADALDTCIQQARGVVVV